MRPHDLVRRAVDQIPIVHIVEMLQVERYEPLLICFMGGIVGLVILSVFLPILNIIGNLS